MPWRLYGDREGIAVVAAFLGHATITGSWAARVPAIKHDVGLSNSELGVALAGMALGTLVGGRLGGTVARRFGGHTVVRAGVPVYGTLLVAAAVAGNLAELVAALFAFGVVAAVVDVGMNTEAVVVERMRGRPLISGFHGVWSVGLMLGALGGVAAAAAGLPPVVHFAIVAAVVAAGSAAALAGLGHPDVAEREAHHPPAPWSLGLLLLGLIAFSSFFAEGAAADWAAVYLHDDAGAGAAIAAAGFAGFSLAMAAARFLGDWLAARFGPVRLVRISTLTAAIGMAIALLIPHPAAGIVGFALAGAGLGPIVPTAVSAAGGARLGSLESVVSKVFTVGYLGGVVGPAMIGFTAGLTGLRAALVIPIALIVFVFLAAGRLSTGSGRQT
jgi:MFS family permease